MTKSSTSRYLILGLLLLAVLGFIISSIPSAAPKPSKNIEVPTSSKRDIAFKKEGILQINKMGGDSVVTIDIELAATEKEREQGLMYRQSLGGLQGMLFLFDETKKQSFWMKNTYIPLDIIFILDDRIVDQYQNADPKSTKSIQSRRPANKVLEVNAGFCRAYNTGPGMIIKYDLLDE